MRYVVGADQYRKSAKLEPGLIFPSQSVSDGKIEEKGSFPGIVGIIDGSNKKMHHDSKNAKAYRNNKKFHSIVLMGIVLPVKKFSYIFMDAPIFIMPYKDRRNLPANEENFNSKLSGTRYIVVQASTIH